MAYTEAGTNVVTVPTSVHLAERRRGTGEGVVRPQRTPW